MSPVSASACNKFEATPLDESLVWLGDAIALRCRIVIVFDFEFNGGIGDNPVPPGENEGNIYNPVCLAFWEYVREGTAFRVSRKVRLFQDELGVLPPYPTGPDVLFVAYEAHAESGAISLWGGQLKSTCLIWPSNSSA
jgi:hypothetical protein